MNQRPESCLRIALLTLALAASGVGVDAARAADPEGAAEEARAEETADTNPVLTEIGELDVQLARQREEIRLLEEDARRTTGDDRIALRSRAMTLRLESAEDFKALVEAVQQLETGTQDAAKYRGRLVEILPGVVDSARKYYGESLDALAELIAERDAAGPEAQLAYEQRLQRLEGRLGEILSIGVANVKMLEAFDLPSDDARQWLGTSLSARARLSASRIGLAQAELDDALARVDKNAGDTASKSEADAARERLDWNLVSLRATVALMEELEMDTTQLSRIVFDSSRNLADAFSDIQSASDAISDWTASATDFIQEKGPGFLARTLTFLVLIAIFWKLSRVVRSVTERAVAAPHLRFSQLLKRMTVSVASGSVLALGFLVALSQLGIQVGPMLAGLGIAGFVLGFALQDTLGNFAAGAMILAYRPYDVGDLIECAGGVFGKVSKMNLVSTTILTVDNQTRVVPNGKIWGDVITNVTAQKHRRVDLVFGISYGDDIPQAEEVLWSIIKEHPRILDDPEPVVKVHELGDSSVNFVVRPWASRDDYWDVRWDVTREVKMRFDREGISIPFPQQDVHFYPGDGGGPAEISLGGATERGKTALDGQDAPDDGGEDEDAG